jgi:uncharacterized protein involved in exopolysaccharide biosynthesis
MNPNEITLTDLARIAWKKRKSICLSALCGLTAGVIVAFSLPRRYTAVVKFVAESDSGGLSAELSGMRSILGLPGAALEDRKLLSTELYPDIVASTPFLADLYKEELAGKTAAESDRILQQKRKNIDVFTDRLSGLTTVSVTDRNPASAARAVDSIVVRLERTLIGTRTGKARADFAFAEARFEEAKANYYVAQEVYARFVDQNRHLTSQSAGVERQRLDDGRQLAYGLFTQLAGQLEGARLRVQEQTPVWTVIEPAAVPVRHSAPRRRVWALAGLVLGTVVSLSIAIGREMFGKSDF